TRADIHDGSEHNTLQSEAGYIDARPHVRRIDETLLQRTQSRFVRHDEDVIRSQGTIHVGHFQPLPRRNIDGLAALSTAQASPSHDG
ncbi:MAG: hypothetical protein WAV78_36615, partial [Xanthobacteraceae bacterium]